MIKKLETEDIVKILNLDDPDFKKYFPCELGEWVQLLNQNVDNPDMLIYGCIEGGLKGYVVATVSNNPLSKRVSILYLKTMGVENNKKVLEKIIEWGRGKKVKLIEFMTDQPETLAKYGFCEKATIMSMEI